jgi:hypothetical protein
MLDFNVLFGVMEYDLKVIKIKYFVVHELFYMETRFLKLGLLLGSVGVAITFLMVIMYYLHMPALSYASIEAIRYAASALSAAIAFFSFSFGMGLAALVSYSKMKSSRLMFFSVITAILGYFFPCERLWRLGYAVSLIETLIIAMVHVLILISSCFLLKKR